jgi:hypothetical protein
MHERLGIGGRYDDGVHLRGDHLVDQRYLLLQVALVLDAVDLEVVLVGVLFLVDLAPSACDEELIATTIMMSAMGAFRFGRFRPFRLVGCGR